MREQQDQGLISSSLSWISNKVKKMLWKSSQIETSQIEKQSCFQLNITKKAIKNQKQMILNKLRKPNSQIRMNTRILKIKAFMSQTIQFQKPLELMCPICIDILIRPIVTVCGHTFCYQCLDQAILFSPSCPVCRNFIRGSDLTNCKPLNEIISKYINKYDNPIYEETYKKKIKDLEGWLTRRAINVDWLEIGDVIDVRDTEFIWCKAIIKDIYYEKGKLSGLLVHYIGWNSIYDQIIDADSQRLAAHKFYTSRVDIPHYHLNNETDENMYSYVIIGQPYIPNSERIPNIDFNFDQGPDFIVENQNQIQNQEQEISHQQGVQFNSNFLPLDYMMINSQESQQSSENQNPEVDEDRIPKEQIINEIQNIAWQLVLRKVQEEITEIQEQDLQKIPKRENIRSDQISKQEVKYISQITFEGNSSEKFQSKIQHDSG